MSETILRMKGIQKRFAGIHALRNVELELRKGEVRALIGENGAGKSTLMKILLGIHQPDEGTIEYNGSVVSFKEPKNALDAGISMIHQEISLIPTIDVAENVWMGREDQFKKGGIFIDVKKRYAATAELFERLGLDIHPKTKVGNLSVAKMQLVELARAVSYDSKIIIMDEPTSALTTEEIQILYRVVRDLAKRGVAIIFISHKIDEIFEICESVTVLRDGQYIGTHALDENLTQDQLIAMIVGRQLSGGYQKQAVQIGEPVLRVENFSSDNVFSDVNFEIRAGEIVGFSGLLGAGRSEIARAIFGIDKHTSGKVFVNGKEVNIKSPYDAIREGIGMVTEDRLRLGSIYALSVKHNLTLANLFRMVRGVFVDGKKENQKFREATQSLSIKYAKSSDLISSLSGGNQQKVIVGRWLMTDPKVLILDEPTRGIDIGAKYEIYKLINDLAGKGLAIMFISSEMPEIVSLCDRTFVVRNGKLVYECMRDEMTQEILAQHAFGL